MIEIKTTNQIMNDYVDMYEFNNYEVEKFLEKKWVCIDDFPEDIKRLIK